MDFFADERDFALLSKDRYTFMVLDRILRGPCELVRTDHEHVILCHSESRYPVWIWTPDGADDSVKQTAWNLAKTHRPLNRGYRYNVKYELADDFIARAEKDGLQVSYAMQLYAYDCPLPMKPRLSADGQVYLCTPEDAEEAAGLLPLFYAEIGEEAPPREACLEKARAYIGDNALFFWKNALGKTVACCSYGRNQGFASLGSVFTLPEERRKHYAQNLVYHVTQKLKDMDLVPMLYTDANYPASNACYEKIGYVLRGRLCTVAQAK